MPTQLKVRPSRPHNNEEVFISLTNMAIECYDAVEGKSLREARSLIKKGDDFLALRDMTK